MSTGQEELIPEELAARYLEISQERLRGFASRGDLRLVSVWGPDGLEVMYIRGEVLKLKERLRGQETEEWPEVIGE